MTIVCLPVVEYHTHPHSSLSLPIRFLGFWTCTSKWFMTSSVESMCSNSCMILNPVCKGPCHPQLLLGSLLLHLMYLDRYSCLARCSYTWCTWLVTLAWLVALELVDVLVISQNSWCLWRSPVHLDLILTIPTPSPLHWELEVTMTQNSSQSCVFNV